MLRVILEAYDLQVCLGLTAQQWSHFVCYWNFNISWYYVLLIASFFCKCFHWNSPGNCIDGVLQEEEEPDFDDAPVALLTSGPDPFSCENIFELGAEDFWGIYVVVWPDICFQFRISQKTHAHLLIQNLFMCLEDNKTSETVLTHLKKLFVEINDLLLTC